MTRKNCIFVVDNDASARKGLARLLRTEGYDVREFASVSDFYKVLSPEISGCLVLDVRMQGMTSEAVFEELNARNIHLSIIVITSDDDAETRRKAQKINATGFFRKPVDGSALLDAIKWTLQTE